MEEAEILSDTVAIIGQGKLIAIDSPLSLKRKFSPSYLLTIFHHSSSPSEVLTSFIRCYISGNCLLLLLLLLLLPSSSWCYSLTNNLFTNCLLQLLEFEVVETTEDNGGRLRTKVMIEESPNGGALDCILAFLREIPALKQACIYDWSISHTSNNHTFLIAIRGFDKTRVSQVWKTSFCNSQRTM